MFLRIKRVKEQLRGIQRLIEEDTNCEKVVQQLVKALGKSFFMMEGCVIAQGGSPADDVADMLARFS